MNTTSEIPYNRPSRKGALNPMWGRHHSEETKRKQSNAAKRRAEDLRKWKDSQHHITMDEFLSNNPTVKEYLNYLVSKQIDEMLLDKSARKI